MLLVGINGFGQITATNTVNVDLYTGTGSVAIPIQSYAIDNVSAGVSLSYDAKGVRVDDLASSVGLGWSLNAGGSITREQHGFEDEVTYPTRFRHLAGGCVPWGSPCPGTGTNTCYNSNDTLQGILVPDAIDPWNIFQAVSPHCDVYDDTERDLFHVNLGGRSFSFTMKGQGANLTYITFPKTEVKIEVFTKDYSGGAYTNARPGILKNIGHDSTTNMLSFVITDENGNRFFFERGDYQVKTFELPTENFLDSSGTYYPVDNWLLHKVITFTGKEIIFKYQKKYLEYITAVSETLFDKEIDVRSTAIPFVDSVYYNPLEIKEIYWRGYKNHISEILYPNNTQVKFDLDFSTVARCDCKENFRLKSISIESGYEPLYKNRITYKLDHAYFNTPKHSLTSKEIAYNFCNLVMATSITAGNGFATQAERDRHAEMGLRLKLKAIRRVGTDNLATEPVFSFGYNETPLPYRLSPAKDYFGYYNGAATTAFEWYDEYNQVKFYDLSIPIHSAGDVVNQNNGNVTWGTSREYNFTNAQAFVLNKVQSGAGGKDSIIYTPYFLENSACSYGNLDWWPYNYPLGCITPEASLVGDTVNDGLVVGRIVSTDKYSVESKTETQYLYKGGKRFFQGGYTKYVDPGPGEHLTNNWIDGRTTIDGSNHGFDTVVVNSYGYNNERLKKSKYVFSNLMYSEGGNTYSCLEKPSFTSNKTVPFRFKKHRMGMPLVSEEYDEHENLVSRTVNHYIKAALPDSIQSRVVIPGYSYWTRNDIDYERLIIDSVTTTRYVYGPGVSTPTTMVTAYKYDQDAFDNVRTITWKDSEGSIYKKHRYYNYNFTSPTSITSMNQAGLQHLLGNDVWKMRGSDSVLLQGDLIAVDYNNMILKFPASFGTTLASPLSSSHANSTSYINKGNALNFPNYSAYGSKFKKAKEYTRYDGSNNVVEIKYGDQNVYESAIWDTHFGHKIADVQNAKYEDIAFTSFDGIYEAIGVSDDNKGNWDFDPGHVIYCTTSAPCTSAITGKYVYQLEQASNTDINYIKSKPLNGLPYFITFWVYTPSASINLSVDLYNGTSLVANVPWNVLNTVGQWKLCTATFTPSQGHYVRIKNLTDGAGNNPLYIDEVRLYPTKATMTTTTYKPLFGAGSSCDASNLITYMEYDVQGRLFITRDMRGNIVQKTEAAVDNGDPNSSSNNSSY